MGSQVTLRDRKYNLCPESLCFFKTHSIAIGVLSKNVHSLIDRESKVLAVLGDRSFRLLLYSDCKQR